MQQQPSPNDHYNNIVIIKKCNYILNLFQEKCQNTRLTSNKFIKKIIKYQNIYQRFTYNLGRVLISFPTLVKNSLTLKSELLICRHNVLCLMLF